LYISFTNRPKEDAAPDGAPAGGERRRRGVRTVSTTVVTFGIVSMLTDISSESITAVLPLYVTAYLGMSTIAYGFLDGLYQGVSALVRIAGGYTSDRLDQPKWVAFVGYAVAAVARVGLLFASGFAALTAVISADRIGKGIRTAPRDSVITASSLPDNLGTSFGVHRTLDNIGAAIGPLLAFVILLLIPDGYGTIFMASLAFAAVGVTILGLFVPNVRTRPKPEKDVRTDAPSGSAASGSPVSSGTSAKTRPAPRPKFEWRVVASGPMRRVLAAAGILGLLTIGDGFIYLVLQSRSDFAAQWFPLLYVGTNIAFLALAIPLGRLSDRIGRARVFVFGHAGLLAAYVVATLPVADVVATLMCLAFLGAFYAATDGVLAALAAQLTTPETHGTGIAAAQTVVAVTRFLSAAGFGILWYAVGRETSMLIVAGLLVIAIVSVLALGATAAVGVYAWAQYRAGRDAPSAVSTSAPTDWASGDRVVFRNTAAGQGYGLVASVPVTDPAGPRAVTGIACDRVAASATLLSCLRSERGITPTYNARLYDATGAERLEWPLPGVPSRTRFSPDGTLVATTAFVTGHAYATIGFSTETVIRKTSDGSSFGNLEDWKLLIGGRPSAPFDRNFWGVTFVDDHTFYATVGMTTVGVTYLVKGDVETRTMTSVLKTVECPSLSPDGTRIAFKRVTSGSGPTVHWTPAVYDIATKKVTVLDAETRSVDDQIAWLDDDTLLYGLPNDTPGDSDVWKLDADGSSAPSVFIRHAWSPAVVTGQ